MKRFQLFKSFSIILAFLLVFSSAKSNDSKPFVAKLSIHGSNLSISDTIPSDTEKTIIDGEVFVKPTQEAVFKGNNKKWSRYFTSKMNARMSNIPAGSCEIGFVIDENGDVKEVKAIKMSNPIVAKAAIDIIENSPKWTPAEWNGTKIKSYKLQPFSISANEMKEVRKEVKAEPQVTPKRKGTHF